MNGAFDGGSHERVTGRLPRWAAVGLGSVTALLGLALATGPFRSMAVLVAVLVVALVASGLVEVARPAAARSRRLGLVSGLGQLALAVALLVWPGPGLRVVTALVAVALVLNGCSDIVSGSRARGTARWSRVGVGLAEVILGVLALNWPDVSLVLVAVAFGVRLALMGVRLASTGSARHPRRSWGRSDGRARRPSGGRWALARGVAAATGAVLLATLGLLVQLGVPRADAFYLAPDSVPASAGQLLRSEPFDRDIPSGARGWRILYTTTRDEGVPAVASAIVVRPDRTDGATPLIAWAHGTTGWATGCAPSVLDHPFEAGALFSLDAIIDEGWTLVAPDYTGLGTEGSHPYLIGQGEARSVLDSIRAVRQLDEVALTESTVVWGHSQGGHASLWTGMLAPSYSPELEISGVAALAPASNLAALVDVVGSIRVGSLFGAYVVQAYTDNYPDVSHQEYVRPGAQVIVREMAARCLAERDVLVSVATALLLDQPVWGREPTEGAFAKRLAENVPSGPIAAPLLIGQGRADTLIAPAAQQAYVSERCAAGQSVDYRTYDGRDHLALVHADSPAIVDLVDWTKERFSGVPATDTCP
jgi:uncharacterized membrane protein HdeD (DUF308 family)/alpha-beta hydrolase superfamily lysophospholipase